MKKENFAALLLGSYFYMFYIGMSISIKAVLLPMVKDYYHINYTASGLMFLLPLLPGLIGTLFTGYLFNMFHQKKLLVIFSLIIMLFSIALPFSHTYRLFLFFTFLISIGTASCATGVNIAVTDVFQHKYPRYNEVGINLIHFLYSFGALLPLVLFSTLSDFIQNWQLPYLIVALSSILILFSFIFSHYPQIDRSGKDFKMKNFFDIMKHPQMIRYVLITFFYGGAECGIASWVPTFLEKGYHESSAYSSFILFMFFLLFTIGRFSGTFLIHKFNKKRLLFVLIFSNIISLIFGLKFRWQIFHFDLFIPLSGLFFSMMFPIFQSYMIEDFRGDINIATSFFFAGSSIGISLLIFIIGLCNDLFGVKNGILIILIYVGLLIPLMLGVLNFKNTQFRKIGLNPAKALINCEKGTKN
ncbi:MAG: MFS transporter [Spirochaetes bacterium]|nr:MFS transporter [Spirochaetota bacterium]